MMRLLVLGSILLYAAVASAQLYRWVDRDGRVHYTNTPPPAGVKSRTLAAPASAPVAPATNGESAPDAAAKDASKGPLTPAEQEQAFRKRQLEAQKAAEKAEAERKESVAKSDNCERAREYLRTLESGQRVSRTNAQGEREYVDDATRARETETARQAVTDWCG
jgi:hypothetical protein